MFIFRGKRVDNGEWVYGWYVEIGGTSYIVEDPTPMTQTQYGDCVAKDDLIEVIPETVGENTGLCDKNGKEIYEGTIFKSLSWGSTHVVEWGLRISARLLKRGMHWPPQYLSCFSSEDIEVIGNQTDNPELLRKGD